MRSKRPSSGDQTLLTKLGERGCTVSLTQIERWRYWRNTGFINRPVQHGKGRGSYSEYPDLDEAVDRICEAEPLVRRYHDLDLVAIVLSARGRPIDPSAVKDAYQAVLQRVEHDFGSQLNSNNGDPTEAAYNAAWALARMLTRGTRARERRQAGHRPPTNLRQTAVIAARLLLGEADLHERELHLLIEETGLAALLQLVGLSTAEAANALKGIGDQLNFHTARRTLETANVSEVVAALQAAHQALLNFLPHDFGSRWSIDRDSLAVFAALGLLARDQAAQRRGNVSPG
jgi:hypothetical protein